MELAMKVNLKKIAAEAGVSIMTVSRALHDRPGVSRELRKKILEIADKFNYLPRRSSFQTAAGNLKSQAAALVLPEIESDFFPASAAEYPKAWGKMDTGFLSGYLSEVRLPDTVWSAQCWITALTV